MAATTVINAAYDTSGNGGRKLITLSNGWIVAGVFSDPRAYFYVSKDKGKTFTPLTFINYSSGINFSLSAKGTNIYVLARASDSVYMHRIDATTVTNTDQWDVNRIRVDNGQTSGTLAGISSVVNDAGTEIHAAWASKNSTRPNSFNIRYAKGTIDGNGNVTWGSVEQISTHNASTANHVNPCIVVMPNGRPIIIHEYQNSSDYRIVVSRWNGTAWEGAIGTVTSANGASVYYGGTYAQAFPCAVVDGNGTIHVVWYGLDSGFSTVENIRYSKSTDGGVSWSASERLTTETSYRQQHPVISVDKANRLYVFWQGQAPSASYYAINRRIYTGSAWVTIENLTPFPSNHQEHPSVIERESGGLIGWMWRNTQSSSVKFDSITLNQVPTLTLTSPADNQTLAEGSTFPIAGEASDADNGNVVTVKYKINNGTARAIASGVSDGSSPLSFAKTLTYSNKRLWDGAVDVTGADLAENVDHVLTVWAEDDQGGKSEEVTRKFRVIWNRPPTISGENGDLGIMEEPPSVEYTVTDPETNPFTITEKINGEVIRTFAGVAGQQETVTIPPDMWLRLEPSVQHELTIEATDSQGMTAIRTYTLTRFVDKIVFSLDFATMQQETKDFFTTDVAAKRLLLTPIWDLPPGAILLVEVCNNAYDAEPTWEDATIVVKLNRAHLFSNTTKTAAQWGINFRIKIEKGTAIGPIYVKGVGGAFD